MLLAYIKNVSNYLQAHTFLLERLINNLHRRYSRNIRRQSLSLAQLWISSAHWRLKLILDLRTKNKK